MPEKCRVIVCGYDPMLVRGYAASGSRALWIYLPDELFDEYEVQSGDKVRGKVLAVYNPDGEKTFEPDRPFKWETSDETGYALNISSHDIVRYELTEFHFVELQIEGIERNGEVQDVYAGEEKQRKWWPEDKMKLKYRLAYAPPATLPKEEEEVETE